MSCICAATVAGKTVVQTRCLRRFQSISELLDAFDATSQLEAQPFHVISHLSLADIQNRLGMTELPRLLTWLFVALHAALASELMNSITVWEDANFMVCAAYALSLLQRSDGRVAQPISLAARNSRTSHSASPLRAFPADCERHSSIIRAA